MNDDKLSDNTNDRINKEDKNDKNVGNNRWWEFYLVRYFVGTIVGTIIILIIAYKPDTFINEFLKTMNINLKTFDVSTLWLFGLVGLAFCYLASAPILVLHAYRATFYKINQDCSNNKSHSQQSNNEERNSLNDIDQSEKYQVSKYRLFLNIVIALIIGSIVILNTNIFELEYSIVLVVFTIQAQIIAYAIYHNKLFAFYNALVFNRGSENNIVKQYTESYRHLREHGNAFFILACEVVLGIVLYNVSSLEVTSVLIFLWIFPACTVWFAGSYLESQISNIN